MRVCLICHEYPPDTAGGGIGTYTAELARGLARAGHTVSVLARATQLVESSESDGAVRVHRLLPARPAVIKAMLRHQGNGKSFVDIYLYSVAIATKVREIMTRDGLDIIESPEHGGPGFALTMKRTHLAHILRFHTPLFLINEVVGKRLSIGGRFVNFMERTTARRATLNTSPSRAMAEVVAARFRVPLDRIRVVPNGIDHETFLPAPRISSDPPTVLYVGRVAPAKGAWLLSAAIPLIVRRVPDAKVIIVGSDHPTTSGTGSTKTEMLARLQRAGVASSVKLLPTMERMKLVPLYQRADVCVLPSLWESFSYTCLEAMACGVPVVATAVGGVPEIIQDGRDGVLVPPNDPHRLAEETVKLLQDPQQRFRMGRVAREKILSTYAMDRVIEKVIAIYHEAITCAP